MGLKQIQENERIVFLMKFVGELVINSAKNERLKHIIRVEKLRRKFVEPQGLDGFEGAGGGFVFKPDGFEKSKFSKPLSEIERKPVFHKTKLPRRITQQGSAQKMRKVLEPDLTQPVPAQQTFGGGIVRGSDPVLEKIDHLIKDNSIQMIECAGPGKNILVKVRNKLNTTKIILGEEEIKKIINYFSNQAKIPVVGGILKAAVRDLVISAVVSDYVGSRFIINKKSPYSLIEGVG